jgi:RNA polymerase sigma-70 factor (ECF subfamily)
MQPLGVRLARGEESAFAELYDACADGLHRYLSVRLRSADHASDVLQATFVRAVKHRKRFVRVENPVAYLFQIARNESARLADRRKRESVLLQSPEAYLAIAQDRHHLDDADIAAAALVRLNPDDRELIELKIYAGLTFDEIARVTRQPSATVATKYRRALESLRPWLEKQLR